MNTPRTTIVAGVLTGGSSRRMGRPKALLRHAGQTLLERTALVAGQTVNEVMLLGRPPFALPDALSRLTILDDLHPGIGPLAGLEALFEARPDHYALLLACDLPRVTPEILLKLRPAGDAADAVVFATAPPPDGWQPCCALYLPSAAPLVREQVRAGRYSLKALLGLVRVQTIQLAPPEAALLQNLNTPQDAAALQWLQSDV